MNYKNIIDSISDKYPYFTFFLICVVSIIISLIVIYGFHYSSSSSLESDDSHSNSN
jgi:hypothetical protein